MYLALIPIICKRNHSRGALEKRRAEHGDMKGEMGEKEDVK